MEKKWRKPIIKHGKMTKYNYLIQYPKNLKLGKNFDIGELLYYETSFIFYRLEKLFKLG